MGRYYSGDIEGKFMFSVQSSNAADRFGVKGIEPQQLEYYFNDDNLEDVEAEILNIETSLGDKLEVLEDLFENNEYFDNDVLNDLGIKDKDLSEYADLLLGIKIRDCINRTTECVFTADL
jgi:hypothetical protein